MASRQSGEVDLVNMVNLFEMHQQEGNVTQWDFFVLFCVDFGRGHEAASTTVQDVLNRYVILLDPDFLWFCPQIDLLRNLNRFSGMLDERCLQDDRLEESNAQHPLKVYQ